MITNRKTEGSFENLIKKYLMSEDDQFVKYFRVTPRIFYMILENIQHEIDTLPCNRVKDPISAQQKLCVTLRYI